jgi:hypothetical protein
MGIKIEIQNIFFLLKGEIEHKINWIKRIKKQSKEWGSK